MSLADEGPQLGVEVRGARQNNLKDVDLDVLRDAIVPDPSLTIRERAIASWPPAWHPQAASLGST